MKKRLIFSTIALAIAGWCYATGYTLTLYADGCESANVIKCDVNQQVNITAVPKNARRHFVRWTDGNTDNPRLVAVTQDMTLTAVFADDPILTLVSSNDNWGKVSGAGQFKPNSSCEISATANYGYHFTQWSDGNTDNTRTIVVTQDTTFTAEFAPNRYTITASGEHGTVEGTGTYDYDTRVSLKAVPDKHYHFVKWSDGNTDNPRTVSVYQDITFTAEFAINQYTIATYAQHGNVSGGGTYNYGTTATLTVTADAHYHFIQWSDGNTDNPRTVSVVGDATYTAEFKPDSYTITVSAGEHGNVNGGGTYDYGTTATLTATADAHYHFTQWTDGNTDNPRTVWVYQDITLTAEFAINQYTITTYAQNGNVSGGGTYDYGTTATLTATANEHYHFTQWSDGNTDNPRTVAVEDNATYTAEFKPDPYTITVSAGEHGGANGGGTYDYGTTATLTATADAHYHFTQWSDGNTDNPRTVWVYKDITYTAEFAINQYTITTYAQHGNVSGGGTYDYGTTATLTATADAHYHFTQWSDGNTDNPRTVAVEDNATYTAEFKPDPYTITVSAGEHGGVSGAGTYDYGTTATLTATADAHYHFTQWSDGNTDNPRTVSVVGDATYTAEFAIDQHTITTNAHNGTITGGGTYDYGTTATLTATANEHYHFTQWSDGNTDNPRTVSVVGDATYTAEFKPDSYTIIVSAGEHGGANGGGTYDYGTTATLTATADAHYHFTQWSDGNTDNPRTVSVVGDATYTAEFAIDRHSITVIYDTQQGVVTGAGMYDYGTQVTLTVIANKGYEFAQWSNGVTDNPYMLTATADLTLEAQFVPATAVDNVSADGTIPQKIIRDGQVYILRNGKTYTTTGVEVK